MTLIAPDYYTKFVCIADKCKHSCCIGWEIDIDEDTYEFYKTIDGPLGERLKNNIVCENDTAHFVLGKDERCPFLNERGLCDIISQLGEGALCQICDDHPRFRNYYSDRTEIGVGMCCEAAAELILSQKEKFKLVNLDEDTDENLYPDEEEFLDVRDRIFEILTNRSKPLENRVQEMLDFVDITLPQKTLAEWVDVYSNLERLDTSWDTVLTNLKNATQDELMCPHNEETETAFEQLLCYFVYRHLTDSLDDDTLWQRVAFAAQSYYMLHSICALHYSNTKELYISDIAEYARMYSSEIEYSQDNMDSLIDLFSEYV